LFAFFFFFLFSSIGCLYLGPQQQSVMEEGGEGTMLALLDRLLSCEKIVKVLHAFQRPMHVLARAGLQLPRNVVDTQYLHAMAGELARGRVLPQSLCARDGRALSLRQLLHEYECWPNLDDSMLPPCSSRTLNNNHNNPSDSLLSEDDRMREAVCWTHRPLSRALIAHVSCAVVHLPDLYALLIQRISTLPTTRSARAFDTFVRHVFNQPETSGPVTHEPEVGDHSGKSEDEDIELGVDYYLEPVTVNARDGAVVTHFRRRLEKSRAAKKCSVPMNKQMGTRMSEAID
jgi:hypothetical protein